MIYFKEQVFAEMGSTNPIIIMPNKIKNDYKGFTTSLFAKIGKSFVLAVSGLTIE